MSGSRWWLGLLGGVVLAFALLAGERALFGFTGPLGAIQRKLIIGQGHGVRWQVVGRGYHQVTDIQFVPGSKQSAIVLLKQGVARLVTLSDNRAARAAESPVVLQVDVRTESECGLLGLAFHPQYHQNGLVYVNYTPKAGKLRTRVSEWRLPKRRLGHQPAEELRTLLEVDQPYSNHNAGQLAFGPDGFLYVGMGDGGKRADPLGAGQDLGSLLGSMLRLDVDGRTGNREYALPPDNPFLGREGARGEIWAYGLRNPWRFSFDERGRLIVADVGQDEFEEVDLVERGDNLGWVVREGRHCFPPGTDCQPEGYREPVFEYPHAEGKSITGGYVYLGRLLPQLVGRYLFADYVSGRLWALELPEAAGEWAAASELGRWPRAISTFGRAADGEVYAGDFASGELLGLVPERP